MIDIITKTSMPTFFAGLTSILIGALSTTAMAEGAGTCEAPTPYVGEAREIGDKVYRSHAIAMHGDTKYGADFEHFDYVNPDAPAGGRFTVATIGSFDSFNPFIDKGDAAATGSIETLTIQSDDEAFTQYGLLAEEIEWPEDRSWVTFYLNKNARWHDGKPVTADDVIWTFNTLIEKGRPFFKFYYGSVENAERIDAHTVKFSFSDNTNRELPLIIGQLPVLAKHDWEGKDFSKPTLEPPLGSGPYQVKKFEAGRYVTLERVEDYWGKDLPVRRGTNNFGEQHTKFYRDDTAIRLALKGGEIDFRSENQAKAWAVDYDVSSVRKGWLNKKLFETYSPEGMQAFILNLRRSKFQDERVRRALDYAFDFEWANKNLFFDLYTRNYSYWSNSELAATGEPQGEELAIIEHYRECIPADVFSTPYEAPVTDGNGWPRENLVKASELLEEAGYEVRDFVLVNKETGEPFGFEMLYLSPTVERILLPYIRNLKRLGIEAKPRIVDSSQYINRIRSFDYDMIWTGWGQSSSPGNEQRDYWSTEAADNPASRNLAGIKDPVIDQLIELVIEAPSRESLVARTRALDRVLLTNRFVVPSWHLPAVRLLYWDKFGLPDVVPKDGPLPSTWWYDSDKAAKLEAAMQSDSSLTATDDSTTTDQAQAEPDDSPGWMTTIIVAIALMLLLWVFVRWALRPDVKGKTS